MKFKVGDIVYLKQYFNGINVITPIAHDDLDNEQKQLIKNKTPLTITQINNSPYPVMAKTEIDFGEKSYKENELEFLKIINWKQHIIGK